MKDENILNNWFDETYKLALSEGLTVRINKEKIMEHYMCDELPFNTVIEEKEIVSNMILKTLSDFENIAHTISIEGWSESNVRLAKEGIIW